MRTKVPGGAGAPPRIIGTMLFDRNDLEIVPYQACLDLLAAHCIGRVGLSMGALPVVLPVNYVLDAAREEIVLRTRNGSKLAAALRNAVVCFEVDEVDVAGRTGWSVIVTGTARELTGEAEVRARALALDAWPPSGDGHLVAIRLELVSGRRVPAVAALAPC